MNTTEQTSTLTDRVRAIVLSENVDEQPIREIQDSVIDDPYWLSPRESAILAWGELTGVAWTLARAEAPFDPGHMVKARAMTAAKSLYEDAFERIGPREDVDDLFVRVVQAFGQRQGSDEPIDPELFDALRALADVVPASTA